MFGEIYIDIFFFINCLMDFLLLRLMNGLLHGSARWQNSLFGAMAGAAGTCLAVILPFNRKTQLVLAHVAINTTMVKIGCKPATFSGLLTRTLFLYGVTFLFGGMLDVILRITGRKGVAAFCLISSICYVILSAGVHWYGKSEKKAERRYKIRLWMNGRCVEGTALLDTGNSLRDISGGRPVSIGSVQVLDGLVSPELKKHLMDFWDGKDTESDFGKMNPHFLPFTGMGCSSGIALAVTLDQIRIESRKIHKVIKRPVMAFSRENSSFGGDYQVILHPDLIDSQEEFI